MQKYNLKRQRNHQSKANVCLRNTTGKMHMLLLFAVGISMTAVIFQMNTLNHHVSTESSRLSPESIAGRRSRGIGVGGKITDNKKEQVSVDNEDNKLANDNSHSHNDDDDDNQQQDQENGYNDSEKDDDSDKTKEQTEEEEDVEEGLGDDKKGKDGDGDGDEKELNTDDGDRDDDIPKEQEEEDAIDEDLKPILKILRQGGYDVSKNNKMIDRSVLPKWSEIIEAYGPPKILGLESCQRFRDTIPAENRNLAAAGMFDSGTNVLASLLMQNCKFKHKKRGIFWQPIWGKHTPAVARTFHTIRNKRARKIYPHYEQTFPVVSVRDPYTWMQSMCRQSYAAQFDHNKTSCPNIIPYQSDIDRHPRFKRMKYIPVNVNYEYQDKKEHYDSLVHLWNEWYQTYIKFDDANKHKETASTMKEPAFPFAVVRLEDLVFHAETVVPQLCECAGAEFRGEFKHTQTIANPNAGIDLSQGLDMGLLRSVIKYGNITNRRKGYPKFQLEAAKELLDPRMMDLLAYPYEEP